MFRSSLVAMARIGRGGRVAASLAGLGLGLATSMVLQPSTAEATSCVVESAFVVFDSATAVTAEEEDFWRRKFPLNEPDAYPVGTMYRVRLRSEDGTNSWVLRYEEDQ
ncbi:MAG TPA: hypothetical protein VLC09_02975 [Polyangiaceae bacterium]|nr:hypothetical protein [Polyangiaceae bacterium]